MLVRTMIHNSQLSLDIYNHDIEVAYFEIQYYIRNWNSIRVHELQLIHSDIAPTFTGHANHWYNYEQERSPFTS